MGACLKVNKMKHVTQIKPTESVDVDQDRLSALYTQLGEASAEDVVCHAMEELALRLAHCDRLYRTSMAGPAQKRQVTCRDFRSNWHVRCLDRRSPCNQLY
jgi:hypothetical protein